MDRRDILKKLFLGNLPARVRAERLRQQPAPALALADAFRTAWHALPNGNNAGKEWVAEQPQHWRVQDGEVQCVQGGPGCALQLHSHQLAATEGSFILDTYIRFLSPASLDDTFAHAGWWLGSETTSGAADPGIRVGVQRCGRLFIGTSVSSRFLPDEKLQQGIRLVLKVTAQTAQNYHAKLTATDKAGNTLALVKTEHYGASYWQGRIALLSHFDTLKTEMEPVVGFGYAAAAGQKIAFQYKEIATRNTIL